MTNQSPLIQYSKKGPPYVKTGGRHHDDFARDPATSDSSIASERCAVRGCANTFTSQPPKIFVPLPVQPSKRSMWLKAIGFDPEHLPSFELFCCEDHFDLKRDVMHLSTLRSVNSGVIPNLLKDNVIPHRQTNSSNPVDSTDDPLAKGDPLNEEMQVFVTSGSRLPEHDPLSSSNVDSRPRIRVRSSQELMISSTTLLTVPSWPPGGGNRTTVTHEPVIPTSVIQTNPHLPKTTILANILMSNGRVKPDGGVYRECAVPSCPHNLLTFPDVRLVPVPIQESARKEWFKAIGKPYSKKSVLENLYVCTAHFREEQLETVKPILGKSWSTNFCKSVKHGVLPTLKLIPSVVKDVQTGSVIRLTQSQRVPDLNRHAPSVLMAESIDDQTLIVKSKFENDLMLLPNRVASSPKPVHVQSRYQKYIAVTMPQYPNCKHEGEEYYCWTLTVEDCSRFHTRFYNLDTRGQQNEFIYSHTEMVVSSSPELKQPAFKFFIDRNNSLGTNKMVLVCARAFSTCLSLEVTALISLVTRHFETFLPKKDSQPNSVLKPIKAGTESEDDDVMIYESVPQILEIEDSSDEEMPIPIEVNGSGRCDDHNFDTPLTVEEELLQTDQQISDNGIVAGNETDTFETVHICRRCLAQFKSKAAFDEHENQISPCRQFDGDVFKCSTCGISLTTYQGLKVHTTVIHKYVCPKCSDTFRYRRYLEDHVVKCSGANRLSDGMRRLVDRTNVMQHKIADTRERKSMASQPVTSNMPSLKCTVVLEKLKIPAGIKETFSLSELTEIMGGQPGDQNPVLHRVPRLKIRAVSNNAAISQISNISSPGDMEEDSHDAEPEEEVDVESTVATTEPDESTKGPAISSKKQSKRKLSKYSGERRSSRRMSAEKQNSTTTRELRTRKPICLAESDVESDLETSLELVSSGEGSVLDPDFVPVEFNPQMKNNSEESDVESDFDTSLELVGSGEGSVLDQDFNPQMKTRRCVKDIVKCSRCNACFSHVSELLAHLRPPEECGKFFPETSIKRDSRKRKFVSTRAQRTPAPVGVDLLNCVYCNKPFSSLYNLRFHLKSSRQCLASARVGSEADEISSLDDTASRASSVVSEKRPHNLAAGKCKGCKVVFTSPIGLGLHLKRSRKCIADNPDIDIPGVVDKSSLVDNSSGAAKSHADQGVKKHDEDAVYVCVKCHSLFSTVWGLRTHERNSADCKPDRPYEIPVPIPKHQADQQKREYLAKQKKECKLPPAPSSSKDTENRTQTPGFLMVYTREPQDEDGKIKCKTCSALFTSVWGLRTHQRISESCMDKNAQRSPRPYQKNKIILSEAAAKSIAKGENICPNCSAKFSTPWGLRTHLRTSSICSESETNIKTADSKKAREGQILSCSKCEMVFLHLKQLRDHVKHSPSCLPEDVTIATNGRVQPGAGCFLCPRCPKTFKVPFSIEQHFIEHAPHKEDWLCYLCTKDFPDRFTMHRHFHREHLGRWFCIMCEKKSVLGTFKEFYAHIFDQHATGTENNKALFKCSTCYKSFISKFSHDFHVSSCRKLAEQVFQCASCQKVFNKKIHITNHVKYAHSGVTIDKRYKYKCPECPRRFLSEKDCLQKHPKESCVQEEIPCEICGEMYAGFEKLKMHLEIAHKKRSELHTGRISPEPGRKSPHPDSGTPETGRHRPEPARAEPIDLTSPSVSPIPTFSANIQESPASPDSAVVNIEPTSP